jgi:hypothetical protein
MVTTSAISSMHSQEEEEPMAAAEVMMNGPD